MLIQRRNRCTLSHRSLSTVRRSKAALLLFGCWLRSLEMNESAASCLATQKACDIDSALTLRQLGLATISLSHAARTGLPFELRIFVAEWSISSRSRDPRTAHDLSARQSDLRAANRSR